MICALMGLQEDGNEPRRSVGRRFRPDQGFRELGVLWLGALCVVDGGLKPQRRAPFNMLYNCIHPNIEYCLYLTILTLTQLYAIGYRLLEGT